MTTSGIGGSYDPGQTNWTLGQDPTKYTGPAEQSQKKDAHVGSPANLVLTQPDETISLHILAGHIGFQQATPEHPVLAASYENFRDVGGGKLADKAFESTYQFLLNGMSRNIMDKFNAEMQKPLAERDPDMQALNLTLQFKAGVINILNSFVREVEDKSPILKAAEGYQSLPERTDQATLDLAASVLTSFEQYAQMLGPNNPGYDTLRNVINEANEHK